MNHAEQVKTQSLASIKTIMYQKYGPIQFAYVVNDTHQTIVLGDIADGKFIGKQQCKRDVPLTGHLPSDTMNIVTYFEQEIAKEPDHHD